MTKPIVWTIAGSDCSGGAGIQSDLLTFQHLNVHACSIITAITAQSSHHVQAIYPLPLEQIQAQLDVLSSSCMPSAIKLGMLGSVDTIKLLKTFFNTCPSKIVLDPIIKSTSGKNLFIGSEESYLRHLITLFPFLDLLTPNLPEAEMLLNKKIHTYDDIKKAAHELLALGVKNVVIKGGHIEDDENSHDYWTNGTESFWLSCPRYQKKNYRGSGCVFSSAIVACLALGHELKDAMVIAKMYINRGIRLAHHHTADTAYIYHSDWPDNTNDLPYLQNTPSTTQSFKFNSCGYERLGLYPVIDSSEWVKKLLTLGVQTIQLRIKDKKGKTLENEIRHSIELAKQYNARLFINDYWQLAIKLGAYGVHLGQEDVNDADVHKIQAAGLRLGISTHCYYEVARAHTYHPSYIAIGPVFKTDSKIMSFQPQGLDRLHYWRRLLPNYPLVAIGGINEMNMHEVLATGVDGVAMISAITKAKNIGWVEKS